jgi:DNA-directed RNA polymerase specialized sigma24 family protein
MTTEEFETFYFPKYDLTIRAIARKLAHTNDTLAEDLYQEGLVALWNCVPERARDNRDAYIRQSVKFRMIDYLRRERIYILESLDARLENGQQIVADAVGHPLIIDSGNRRSAVTKRKPDLDPEEDV